MGQAVEVVNLNGTSRDRDRINSASPEVDKETVQDPAHAVTPLPLPVFLGANPENGGHDRDAIEKFIRTLCTAAPGFVQTVRADGKDLYPRFHTTDERGLGEAVSRLENLSRACAENSHLYVQISTCVVNPNTDDQPDFGIFGRRRGGKDNVSHLLCLWNDIDYGQDGHAEAPDGRLPNPPDAAAAHEIYVRSGLPEASVIINSGGGLYELVLLETPFDMTSPGGRKRGESVARRWQQRIEKTAREMGYHYGAGVSNADRVLRVPGTVNTKVWNNKRRATAHYMDEARYCFDDLEALINDLHPEPEVPRRPDGGRISVERLTGPGGDHLPGTDFNARGDWQRDILDPAGITYAHAAGNVTYWCRPGKSPRDGHSFSLNHKPDLLFSFTDGTALTQWKYYDKFSAFAHLFHGGDFKAAAAELRTMRYGTTPSSPAPAPQPPQQQQQQEQEEVSPAAEEATEEAPAPPAPPAPPATATAEPEEPVALPTVDITNERDGLHNLTEMISKGALPEVYVRDGRLVHVGVVSGARNGRRKKPKAAAERTAPDMSASQLRALVARYAYSYAYDAKGVPKPKLPGEALCKSVLAATEWTDLPDLVEITPMPFVREDGTICQRRGYDEETGVWLNVDEGFPEVPDSPTAEQIAEAKDLLLNKVLRDFPFVGDADRANYMGLLSTPALKRITGDVTMFGVITAAAAGSGKSLLAEIISRTYGGNGDAVTLPRQDEELRKLITTQLTSNPHAVVTFDNIGKSHRVDSSVLSSLMTLPVWSDRLLGGNENVSRVNDKLWLGTGNNVQLGGEMASRSALVRIDPKMERPDKRDTEKFVLGNLQTWMSNEDNRIQVMHALLILIKAWAAAGMPKRKIDVRTFTTWASTIAGFLDFHGITGFLTNADEVDEADEESYEWAQFLTAWHTRHGGEWLTTAQLLASYRNTQFEVMSGGVDPWNGAFPLRENGQPYTSQGLGMKLKYIIDRPFQGWVLRKQLNKSTKMQMWRAERMQEQPPPEPPGQTELAIEGTTPPVPAQRTTHPATTTTRLHEVRGNINTLIRTLSQPVNTIRTRHEEDRQ